MDRDRVRNEAYSGVPGFTTQVRQERDAERLKAGQLVVTKARAFALAYKAAQNEWWRLEVDAAIKSDDPGMELPGMVDVIGTDMTENLWLVKIINRNSDMDSTI